MCATPAVASVNEEEERRRAQEEEGADGEVFESSELTIDDTGEFVRTLPQLSSFQKREQERKAKEEEARKRRKAFKSQKELLRQMAKEGVSVVDEDDAALNMQPQQRVCFATFLSLARALSLFWVFSSLIRVLS